jgi:hypothetical protein
MERLEAKILLKNLLKRIRQIEDDHFELNGSLTDDEVIALRMALQALDNNSTVVDVEPVPKPLPESTQNITTLKPVPQFTPIPVPEPISVRNEEIETQQEVEELTALIELDTSIFDLPAPPSDRRLCLDFGTAMSKVTMVIDKTESNNLEEIHVLDLGVAGDQEEVSETMLISSVYIDENGRLWFGKKAQDLSKFTPDIQRLDNIKRYLSEEGLQDTVVKRFNPTEINIIYADLVLAYLMFLTWTVNYSLESSGEPRNLNRRFAMPCFDGGKSRETHRKLASMLGEAQVLADTFYQTLQDGIPLEEFVGALTQLREEKRTYDFVKEGITEPLGVAGSLISWEGNVNSLVMVVDVGAGTSDFSLYRMAYNPSTGKSAAFQVENSTSGITEAGNYLDNLLRGLILNKAEITYEHEHYQNYLGNLELDLRDYKEQLFTQGEVNARLFNGEIVHIDLDDFLKLSQVEQFAQSLIDCRDDILHRVNTSFVKGAPNNTLALALTGGGASLPMVKSLAQGKIDVNGVSLNLVQTKAFPSWLEEEYDELEQDYPRIAVSLGGARKRIISHDGIAKLTAGDIKETPVLDGYFTKGS